jgi:hypothetical protein
MKNEKKFTGIEVEKMIKRIYKKAKSQETFGLQKRIKKDGTIVYDKNPKGQITFKKLRNILLEEIKMLKNIEKVEDKRGEPMKCDVCKHNLVYSEEDKIFYCPNCGQKYD